jgi:hypothetical protein
LEEAALPIGAFFSFRIGPEAEIQTETLPVLPKLARGVKVRRTGYRRMVLQYFEPE